MNHETSDQRKVGRTSAPTPAGRPGSWRSEPVRAARPRFCAESHRLSRGRKGNPLFRLCLKEYPFKVPFSRGSLHGGSAQAVAGFHLGGRALHEPRGSLRQHLMSHQLFSSNIADLKCKDGHSTRSGMLKAGCPATRASCEQIAMPQSRINQEVGVGQILSWNVTACV